MEGCIYNVQSKDMRELVVSKTRDNCPGIRYLDWRELLQVGSFSVGNNRNRMGCLIERVAETGDDSPAIRGEECPEWYAYRNLIDSRTIAQQLCDQLNFKLPSSSTTAK